MIVQEGHQSKSVHLAKDVFWESLQVEAVALQAHEPVLASFVSDNLLSHTTFLSALAWRIQKVLEYKQMMFFEIEPIIEKVYDDSPFLIDAAKADLNATMMKDPACHSLCQAFLFFKGFIALQIHRVAHVLYRQGRQSLAFFLQSNCSEKFSIDIHPAARMGQGIFIDHAHGIVIGETAVVGDNVSILHSVTLGGKGVKVGDRHPKIGRGVTIGAGASVLGNIRVGDYVTIAAGSIVLKDVPSHSTAVGIPARVLLTVNRAVSDG